MRLPDMDDVMDTVKFKLHPLTLSVRLRMTMMKIKVKNAKKKVVETKRRGVLAARNRILPAIPGISKLELPVSPAPDLLLTNAPPSDQKATIIHAVISQAKKEQAKLQTRLDERMARGSPNRTWVAVTLHKIERATEFIRQHEALVSPLRRMPPEILQEIFLWFVSARPHTRWTISRDIPWTLAQVCRTWRDNALALSSLWSHLPTVDLTRSDSRARTRVQVDCLTELIRRSKTAPLDIYLFALGYDGGSHPVIELLAKHCERWQVVTIKINLATLVALRRVKGRLPQLKTLNLYLTGYDDGLPPIDMFEGAPQLRQVDVGGPFLAELALPFSQLAHYKDKIRMRNSITRVVTAANSLEALTIMELCESSDTAAIPPVTLPHLVKLQVKFCCTRPQFLNNLSLPSIEEIRMVSFHDEAELIPSLVNIIRNSGPGPSPLKILRFRTQGVQAGQLSVLLQLTPALETLDMPIPPPEDLALLVQGGMIPRLEKCEFFVNDFTHSAADDVTTKALELLAASRCEMSSDPASLSAECSRIKKFCLHFDRPRLIQAQLALLEGWERTSGKELVHFKNQIFSEIPELECRRPRRARKFDRRWVDRVLALLESIENYKVNRVGDVYTSELHLVLKMLTERQLLGDDKCLFRQRANTILKKWEPLFEQSLSSRHWVMKGEYSLVYISENDAIRTGPDALTNIVYGIEDDTRLHYPAFLDF